MRLFRGSFKMFGTAFLCSFLVGLVIIGFVGYNRYKDNHNRVRSLLGNQAAQINNEVVATIDQVYYLRALIEGCGGKNVELTVHAPNVLKTSDNIRNVLVAPKGVVSSVYPLHSNEAVLGLDLLGKENRTAAEAKNARNSRDLVLSGPYELKQGGLALSGRLSVYLPDGQGKEYYWGLASVSVDFPKVFDSGAVNYLKKAGYSYRLLRQNDQTKEFVTLLENLPEKLEDPEEITFNIYNMSFKLVGTPPTGWLDYGYLLLGLLAVLAISVIIGVVAKAVTDAKEKWQVRAMRDGLTGLLNRDAAQKEIEKIVSQPHFVKGAFIILDIDDFKGINDAFGHQVGDRVLIENADMLMNSCREDDVVCRLGGDEFLIFFAYKGDDEFLHNKLHRLIQCLDRPLETELKSGRVTCSAGVALTEQAGTKFTVLYKQADDALYRAKNNGKNGYAIYKEEGDLG